MLVYKTNIVYNLIYLVVGSDECLVGNNLVSRSLVSGLAGGILLRWLVRLSVAI